MREYWDLIVQTAAVTKMIDTIRSIMSRKVALVAGAAAIILVVAATAFAVGRITGSGDQRVGGLDLAGYCRTIGYETNTQALCLSRIDLDKACDWDHQRTDLRIKMTGDLYSGICYDPATGEEVGGIRDMTGYCQDDVDKRSIARIVDNQAWFCQESINKNVACIVLYREEGLKARLDTNDTWYCYRG